MREEASMMREAVAVFDGGASDYDAPRRRLVPGFEDFYGIASAVAASVHPVRVLDLGAGTGLLAGHVAAAVPGVHITLLDAAPAMLDLAAVRLSAAGVAFEVHHNDLADPLPPGPFDAAVSALAIHHLDDPGKRDLYARVRAVLRPGGVFVNAEQVAGPTPAMDRRYHDVWLAEIRERGATDEEVEGARQRMAHDRPAPVDPQCAWLRELGFVDVDCFYRRWRFAVFGGWV
jgi:tRNA (cmo5U34)-methyltransferase